MGVVDSSIYKHELSFKTQSPLVTIGCESYRPPSFPPPDDWVITVDDEGNPLSRYGDTHWNYSAFGFSGFNFGNHSITEKNLRLVKQCLLFILYSRLFPGKVISCNTHFYLLVKIAVICDQHGILISELSKYPAIHPLISGTLAGSFYGSYITILHRLLQFDKDLGFVIADKQAINFLVGQDKDHENIQTAYIPPRIWSYQLNRLDECLNDFIEHKVVIEKIFNKLSLAYTHNSRFKSAKEPPTPFMKTKKYKDQVVLADTFDDFLKSYGLSDLFDKWIERDKYGKFTTVKFSAYLSMIRNVTILYLLNFSLQRVSETRTLRSDCFDKENDEKLGSICLIHGETTKTDPDSDARWVVPAHVEKAINAASTIALWRMRHRPKGVSREDRLNPYLLTPAWEPWGGTKAKDVCVKKVDRYDDVIRRFPKLFARKEVMITEEDWNIALSLTPNLDKKEGIGIGMSWPLSCHQLRRTTCVNMFSSEMVSQSSLQFSMKHLERNMTLYYGRNYANVRLNKEAEVSVIKESYRAVYRRLCAVVQEKIENVRPHAKEMIPDNVIRLLELEEEKKLTALIKKGAAGCRRTLLGYCMKSGSCEYGGIDSVAMCAGGNGKGICADAIFSRKNKAKLLKLKEKHEQSLEHNDKHSPKYSAAMQEIYAIEVYLNVVNK